MTIRSSGTGNTTAIWELFLYRLFPIIFLPHFKLVFHHEQSETEIADQDIQALVFFIQEFPHPPAEKIRLGQVFGEESRVRLLDMICSKGNL